LGEIGLVHFVKASLIYLFATVTLVILLREDPVLVLLATFNVTVAFAQVGYFTPCSV